MDADTAIQAIIKFNARRPGLNKLYSDQGSNFTAADKILKRELAEINKNAIPGLAKMGISWEFNPAWAPHRGGVWERIVSLFKKHLKIAVSGDILQDKTFETIVIECEAVLNRRPLTHISTDSKDIGALTPNHFLSPAAAAASKEALIDFIPTPGGDGLRTTWKHAISRINGFWKSFRKDYLTLLHQRPKWTKTKKDLKASDLVIVVDETTSRDAWKLGRVLSVTSTGTHVRTVEVQLASGKIRSTDRSSLVLLELDE